MCCVAHHACVGAISAILASLAFNLLSCSAVCGQTSLKHMFVRVAQVPSMVMDVWCSMAACLGGFSWLGFERRPATPPGYSSRGHAPVD